MASSTIKGFWRQTGNTGGTPSVSLQCIQFTFDPTQVSASIGKTMPKGAIPLFAQNMNGGGTGGTNPTIDIGRLGCLDGFANEIPADAKSTLISGAQLMGVPLLVDTLIFAGVGASAATGGTITAGVYYIMQDSG